MFIQIINPNLVSDTEDKSFREEIFFYILLPFLLITIALLIAVGVYRHKQQIKKKFCINYTL